MQLSLVQIIVLNMNTNKQKKNNKPESMVGVGIALGISFGVAIGVALGNVGVGIALGIAFGVAYDAAMAKKNEMPQDDE